MALKIHILLLDAQTTNGTTSAAVGPGVLTQVSEGEGVIYVTFSVGSSAGVVVIEGAPYTDYTGTWSNLGTITWAAADRTHRLNYTGKHLALRARITTAVTGGTVDVLFAA